MEFTFAYTKMYIHGLWLASPLLLSFVLAIVALGLVVGKKECWSKLDSLYWAFITATTVGYGDIRPLRRSSKLLAVVIALVGLIFTGILVALAIHAATTAFSQLYGLEQIEEGFRRTG